MFDIGRALTPYLIFAGKNFGREWDIGPSAEAPAESLAGILAAEVRLKRQGPDAEAEPAIVWKTWGSTPRMSIDQGDKVFRLFVPGDGGTDDMPIGRYEGLFSIGSDSAEAAEEPVFTFAAQVRPEPGA